MDLWSAPGGEEGPAGRSSPTPGKEVLVPRIQRGVGDGAGTVLPLFKCSLCHCHLS